ncbi:gluconate 2-dehydrogenase subunit 3 family protein [Sphingobacterium deserti]|uniref:Twin-arginine translocation pathway signal n=1 Tax=Sphingobacterium deserti TaxID=1229276 RepID=A0A0B8T5X5_9SPHI|nr:gluconate 2-dehydrogenase subunit 3 family protein [Sphingobacterium deserti]KGE16183.1 twin-arginine translocation pathway signal [Sphingobacterium deserti]
MDRRELLKMVALLTGGSIIGGNIFLTGCTSGKKQGSESGLSFNKTQIDLLNEVADTILPTTERSPGAKAADVGSFMTVIVKDCYEPEDQKIFLSGISELDEQCIKTYKTGFVDCTAEQKLSFLTTLEKEAKEYKDKKNTEERKGPHYFTMFKQLTLLGYFTSEIGCTQAMRYVAIPGRYEGDVPYHAGDRAWAT